MPDEGVRRNPDAVAEKRGRELLPLYPSIESLERSEFARDAGREPLRDVGPREPDLLVGRLPPVKMMLVISHMLHIDRGGKIEECKLTDCQSTTWSFFGVASF